MPTGIKNTQNGIIEPPKPVSRRCIEWVATQLHQPKSLASGHVATALSNSGNVTILCISDTHNTKPDLPAGDVLLHAGDLSSKGTFAEIQEQLDWLNAQPHEHKIVIAGNHDTILDDAAVSKKAETRPDDFPLEGKSRKDLQWGSLIYLEGSCVTLTVAQRRIKIYGSPLTPAYGTWAFQYPPMRDVWAGQIPNDVDIVMTHGPPRGHMDPGHFGKKAGCPHLLRELRRVRPKLHVFGHIHEGRGQEVLMTTAESVAYEDVMLHGKGIGALFGLLSAKATSSRDVGRQTLLVNAAVVRQPPYTEALPATVVTI